MNEFELTVPDLYITLGGRDGPTDPKSGGFNLIQNSQPYLLYLACTKSGTKSEQFCDHEQDFDPRTTHRDMWHWSDLIFSKFGCSSLLKVEVVINHHCKGKQAVVLGTMWVTKF